ncbi:flavoprotein-like protein [Microdochium trichocladiopsis]|uniref:Flavoprotein-like protein n=1 Tax=Microdochium trichocladiopsis TaxID=1682393 RepID=A0A9P8XZI4_9PEZI|nr:flavoprotein-like protein [Microdochium trichocladiopsis]KAH7021428.1 flavoprotein-like protein [Microdochium trichocladiopsis]
MAAKSIAVITTSTRATRVGPQVTGLVLAALNPLAAASAAKSKITLTHVDLNDFGLPIFHEKKVPATVTNAATDYEHEYSRKWSAEIAKHDAYILTVPEYNFGMAASTKNAIDYLYHEWKGKPVGVVSYGIMGGNSAREQVRKSLGGVGLKVTAAEASLAFPGGPQGEDFKTAMFTGELTEGTKTEWAKVEGITKIFEELVEELEKDLSDKVAPANGEAH